MGKGAVKLDRGYRPSRVSFSTSYMYVIYGMLYFWVLNACLIARLYFEKKDVILLVYEQHFVLRCIPSIK